VRCRQLDMRESLRGDLAAASRTYSQRTIGVGELRPKRENINDCAVDGVLRRHTTSEPAFGAWCFRAFSHAGNTSSNLVGVTAIRELGFGRASFIAERSRAGRFLLCLRGCVAVANAERVNVCGRSRASSTPSAETSTIVRSTGF
jgi:hypothetical protein